MCVRVTVNLLHFFTFGDGRTTERNIVCDTISSPQAILALKKQQTQKISQLFKCSLLVRPKGPTHSWPYTFGHPPKLTVAIVTLNHWWGLSLLVMASLSIAEVKSNFGIDSAMQGFPPEYSTIGVWHIGKVPMKRGSVTFCPLEDIFACKNGGGRGTKEAYGIIEEALFNVYRVITIQHL